MSKTKNPSLSARMGKAVCLWLAVLLVGCAVSAWLLSSCRAGQGSLPFLASGICLLSSLALTAAAAPSPRVCVIMWLTLAVLTLLVGLSVEAHAVRPVGLLLALISHAVGCFLGVTFGSVGNYKKKHRR